MSPQRVSFAAVAVVGLLGWIFSIALHHRTPVEAPTDRALSGVTTRRVIASDRRITVSLEVDAAGLRQVLRLISPTGSRTVASGLGVVFYRGIIDSPRKLVYVEQGTLRQRPRLRRYDLHVRPARGKWLTPPQLDVFDLASCGRNLVFAARVNAERKSSIMVLDPRSGELTRLTNGNEIASRPRCTSSGEVRFDVMSLDGRHTISDVSP